MNSIQTASRKGDDGHRAPFLRRTAVASMSSFVIASLRKLPWPSRPWMHVWWRSVWLGPLLGGLPYNVMVIGIPFSYALGIGPAVVGGAAYATWHLTLERSGPYPNPLTRILVASVCGAAGVLVCLLLADIASTKSQVGGDGFFVYLLPHAVVGAALTALTMHRGWTVRTPTSHPHAPPRVSGY